MCWRRWRQGTVERFTSRIASAVIARLAPLQNRADALPDTPGRFRFDAPYWLQNGEHIATAYPIHLHVADNWQNVAFERAPPIHRVLSVAPSGQVRLVHSLGDVPENGNVFTASFSHGIATRGDERLIGKRQGARLGQANRRISAESQVPAPAVDHDSLHPRPRPRSGDAQIEPVSVAVHTRLLDRLDLCGGESRHSQPITSPTLMWGNLGYFAGTLRSVIPRKPRKSGVFSVLSGTIRIKIWRMGWDSNPRGTRAPAGFQDRCLRPLGHPSAARCRQTYPNFSPWSRSAFKPEKLFDSFLAHRRPSVL